jgi:hypothetical protein
MIVLMVVHFFIGLSWYYSFVKQLRQAAFLYKETPLLRLKSFAKKRRVDGK